MLAELVLVKNIIKMCIKHKYAICIHMTILIIFKSPYYAYSVAIFSFWGSIRYNTEVVHFVECLFDLVLFIPDFFYLSYAFGELPIV